MSEKWLALIVGNTRLHWGFFAEEKLVGVWHTAHLTAASAARLQAAGFQAESWQDIAGFALAAETALPPVGLRPSSLWVASAVPAQAALWQNGQPGIRSGTQPVERSRIPLSGLYPTLGIDRAINLLGAGSMQGWPVLVIDGGTALTFTAGTHQSVYGGAILAGVSLQGRALAGGTAALEQASTVGWAIWNRTGERSPASASHPPLPARWATDTAGAIASGLTYGAIAAINDYLADWWTHFPTGKAVITGGDGPTLHAHLQQTTPEVASRVAVDSNLMFWGMRAYRNALMLEL